MEPFFVFALADGNKYVAFTFGTDTRYLNA